MTEADAKNPAHRPPRRRHRRWPWVTLLIVIVILGTVWGGINYVAARYIATHGVDQTTIGPAPTGTSDVVYDPANNIHAWFARPKTAHKTTVVIIHGYQANRGDGGDIAAQLRGLGYGTLQIDLGYESGTRPYGGGQLEATEVSRAVAYAQAQTSDGPVGLLGLSAGGTAAILAAAEGAPVVAVVADSSPSSFVKIAVDQSHLPSWLFALTPALYGHFSPGGTLIDLQSALSGIAHPYKVPTLIIQGTADTTVAPSNGPLLAAVTHGQLWTLQGVGHVNAFATEPTQYTQRLTTLF